jgi:glycosyltransferase involved in cell wall biosynthesis
LPALLERPLLGRGRPIVYDIDDAFFHTYNRHRSVLVRSLLGAKFQPLLRAAKACICGNSYLSDYVSQFCGNTLVIPTAVDTGKYHPLSKTHELAPVIGWIGSPSTWRYVRPLLPLLRDLVDSGRARVKVVGAGAAAATDSFPGLELVDWSEEREIDDVRSFDVGIMPLPDDDWARGKSGYKLIQYMACGLPCVASPVGVNSEILNDDCGILASTIEDWRRGLTRLIDCPELRALMGAAGRSRAQEHYSLAVHAPRLVNLFLGLGTGIPSAA